jgi:hypothetical protein
VRLEQGAAIPFTLAAIAGIILWFLLLVALVERYGDRFSPATIGGLVRFLGGLIALFGLWFLALFGHFLWERLAG